MLRQISQSFTQIDQNHGQQAEKANSDEGCITEGNLEVAS